MLRGRAGGTMAARPKLECPAHAVLAALPFAPPTSLFLFSGLPQCSKTFAAYYCFSRFNSTSIEYYAYGLDESKKGGAGRGCWHSRLHTAGASSRSRRRCLLAFHPCRHPAFGVGVLCALQPNAKASSCTATRPARCAAALARQHHAIAPRSSHRHAVRLHPHCAAAIPVNASQAATFRDLLAGCLGYAVDRGLDVSINVSPLRA